MKPATARPGTTRPCTIRQCAILAGGLGTRLGALTAHTPKPILPVGGRPFLAWLLRELVRFGVEEAVLLTGHLAPQVEDAVRDAAARLPRPLRLRFSAEPTPAGTGGALHWARDLLDERFLLLNGDSLFDTNLARLLADAAADGPEVTGRMLLRHLPDAGRYGVVDTSGDRIAAFRERSTSGGPGTINAGVSLFNRRVLDEVAPHCSNGPCSLERDVLPRLAARGALRGTVADGYFIDIGVPDDFARAQTELPRRLRRPALFLDRDGVLNVDHGWVGTRERWEWTPAAREAVAAATGRGWHVFVVTNQSGIARGHYDEAALRSLHGWMEDELHRAGGTVDDWRFCPFHPDATVAAFRHDAHPWRKPAPGMIVDLLQRWDLDPARCVLVGDQPTDLAAAQAAGIRGVRFEGTDLLATVERLPGFGDGAATCPEAATPP